MPDNMSALRDALRHIAIGALPNCLLRRAATRNVGRAPRPHPASVGPVASRLARRSYRRTIQVDERDHSLRSVRKQLKFARVQRFTEPLKRKRVGPVGEAWPYTTEEETKLACRVA